MALFAFTNPEEFVAPWDRTDTAIVIDPYQGNSIDWDQLATDRRVAGIIHRATIGLHSDSKYSSRREEALRRGYKWGSYHLGRPGDPIKQADFYLTTVGSAEGEVLALDIESLNTAKDMSLANAVRFIEHIYEKTGRYPMVYGNHAVIRQISRTYGAESVFAKTHLWYARFRRSIPDFPTGVWSTYTLWQFNSEINCKPPTYKDCLYRVAGTKSDMDVNVFNGTVQELRSSWPFDQQPSN